MRVFPLILPQVVSLVTDMDPLDPEFRRKWTACLQCIGERLFAPAIRSGDELDGKEDGPVKARKHSPPRPQPAVAGIKDRNFTVVSDQR